MAVSLWEMVLSIPTGDGHDQEQDSEYHTRISSQGKSIQDIAITLGIARNTVRKYLRHPELVAMPHPRPNRRSKLDPFKEQVKKWTRAGSLLQLRGDVAPLTGHGLHREA